MPALRFRHQDVVQLPKDVPTIYVEVATTDEMVLSVRGRAGTWSVLRILLGIDDLLAVFWRVAALARGAS